MTDIEKIQANIIDQLNLLNKKSEILKTLFSEIQETYRNVLECKNDLDEYKEFLLKKKQMKLTPTNFPDEKVDEMFKFLANKSRNEVNQILCRKRK